MVKWSDIEGMPSWLDTLQSFATKWWPPLKTFLKNPVNAVVGIVATVWLSQVQKITAESADSLLLVLGGSVPFGSPRGEAVVGLADLPAIIVRIIIGVGAYVAEIFFNLASILNLIARDVASQAGPLAPLVLAGFMTAYFFGALLVLRWGIAAVSSYIPGQEYLNSVAIRLVGVVRGGEG